MAALSTHYTVEARGLDGKRLSAGLSDKRLHVHGGSIPKSTRIQIMVSGNVLVRTVVNGFWLGVAKMRDNVFGQFPASC